MFHQPFVNPPTIPPAPPPVHPSPQLDLSHIPPEFRRAGFEYDSFLQQLTFNSKDVITSLTQIAGENLRYAEAIVTVVEQRAYHAPAHQKLPFLYLIDSIVKNIGAKYIVGFGANLYHTFINAYAVASQEVRMSMHRLLNTWPPIFGLDIVTAMRRSTTDHDAQAATAPPHIPPQQPISHALRLPQGMQQPHTFNYPSNPQMEQPAIHPPTIQPPMQQPQAGIPPQTGMPPQPGLQPQTSMQPHTGMQPQAGIQPQADIQPQPGMQLQPVMQPQPVIPPMAQPGLQRTLPQPSLRQPPRVPPQLGPQVSAPIPQSVSLPQVPPRQGRGMLQSQPAIPQPLKQHAHAPMNVKPMEQIVKPLPPKFVEVQNTMQGITRKAAMGVHPSSHQVFTMNRLITEQLQSKPPPFQRDALLRYQQQLRDICATPRQTPPLQQPNYPCSAPHASAPAPLHVPPTAVTAALSGLLRSAPPGLLSRTQSHAPQQQQAPPMNSHNNPTAPTTEMLRSGPPMPRRPDMGTPVFQRRLPTALKFADLKTMSHASAVRALYTELPHLSKSDGMRFATTEELRNHLDWLFHQNRRKRGKAPNVVVGGSSRGWFEHLDTFLEKQPGSGLGNAKEPSPPPVNANLPDSKGLSDQQASGSTGTKDRSTAVTESKGENELCAACNESFESFWDDDRQAWMLKGAERTDEGEVFHTRCIEMIEADEKQKEASATDYEQTEPQTEQSPHPVSPAVKLESIPPLDPNTQTTPEIPAPKGVADVAQQGTPKLDIMEEVNDSQNKVEKLVKVENVVSSGSGQKRMREEIEETTLDEGAVPIVAESAETVIESQGTDVDEDVKSSLAASATKLEEPPEKRAKVEEEVLDGADGSSASPQ